MKKKTKFIEVISVTSIFTLLFLLSTIQTNAAELNQYIPDEELLDCIERSGFNSENPSGEYSQQEFEDRAKDFTSISCASYYEVTDFEGLQYFTNLETLIISNADVNKLPEQLSSLKKLETLRLEYYNKRAGTSGRLWDLSSISELDNLTDLTLTKYDINDFEVIGDLTNLTNLNLKSNRIVNFDGIEKLVNLESLNLYGNRIEKIENLENLKNLESLNLALNHLESVENLDELSSLTELNLAYNDIVDISSIKEGVPSTVTDLNLSRQSIYLYLQRNNDEGYEEVFKKTNCQDEDCAIDFDNFLIDNEEYIDTIESGSKYENISNFGRRITYDYDLSTVSNYQGDVLPENNNYSLHVDISTYDFRTNDLIDYVDNAFTNTKELMNAAAVRIVKPTGDSLSSNLLTVSSWGGYDINDPQPGEYKITLAYDLFDMESTFTYTILPIPVVYTNDTSVLQSDAPSCKEDIIIDLETELLTSENEMMESEEIADMETISVETNSYDVNNPQPGDYEITVKYNYDSGLEVQSTSILTVMENEIAEPEVTEPEVTEPEVTEPEVTEPEEIEPEVTEPEVTEPEVTEPEITEPEVTENTISETGIKYSMVLISMLIVSIFALIKVRVK